MPDQREQRSRARAQGRDRPRGRGAHAGPPADESPELLLGLGGSAPGQDSAGGGGQTAAGAALAVLAARLRPRTVRARVVAVLALPVVSLLALWALAAVTTAQSIDQLIRAGRTDARLLGPLDSAIGALQAERLAAAAYAAAPSTGRARQLSAGAAGTDAAARALRTALTVAGPDASTAAADLPARMTALSGGLDRLADLRRELTGDQQPPQRPAPGAWRTATAAYGGVVDQALSVVSALSAGRPALVASAREEELLAREDTAVRSAQAAGRLTPDEYQLLDGAAYARAHPDPSAPSDPMATDLADPVAAADPADARTVAAAEAAIRQTGPGAGAGAGAGAGGDASVRLPSDPSLTGWPDAVGRLESALQARVSAQRAALTAAVATPYRTALASPAGVAVLLGLLAACVSLLLSVRVGRALVVELVALRNSALDLAFRRLPDALRRLRSGEEVDLDLETARARPAGVAGRGEVGEVGNALGLVQRAALQAAVERAEVMSGVSGVFVNLARRSQVLLHRQLRQLDAMERRTEDPAELSELFRLDHLTTRMRRHAESLIILSGASPGRGWRRPVPLLDVVRAAVGEVEEYARVDIRRLSDTRLTGGAVADVTHLLAELVENATAFSPPNTPVTISGDRVGAGYALEVEDRGLGMGADALAAANRRIAESRQGDFFDGDRLGLYVVSRLAQRNGLDVALRRSPYGGITAVVLIPAGLLAAGGPGEEAATGGPRRPERPAPVPRRVPAAPSAPTVEWGPPAASAGGEPDLPPSAGVRPGGPIASPRPLTALPGGGGLFPLDPLEPTPPVPTTPPGPATPPEPATPPASQAPPEPPVPPEHPAPPTPTLPPLPPLPPLAADPPGADEALPRRVRQASLAPQLREEPPAPGGAEPAESVEPDRARATMSALQRGWTRGRLDDAELLGESADDLGGAHDVTRKGRGSA
ncbi:sensor histidine kinase [Phaeacidiphilus oryzae]|uniref:sensor histidine kinase n=1 Tax=Phaeacidiphilus oryzae TaxID=348818 RepID=UPI0006923DA5|nr:nitrate- and nitrite sensing domain-containing protein [Phaeacidiphilus oryzae]